MTGFGRFFIFLIIFVPIAYIAAAYLNGEDALAPIREMWEERVQPAKPSGNEPRVPADTEGQVPEQEKGNVPSTPPNLQQLRQENQRLRDSLANQQERIRDLQERIHEYQNQ